MLIGSTAVGDIKALDVLKLSERQVRQRRILTRTADSGPGTMAALSYPRSVPAFPFSDTVDTEWVSYPNIYESRCSDSTHGHALEIDLVTKTHQKNLSRRKSCKRPSRTLEASGVRICILQKPSS